MIKIYKTVDPPPHHMIVLYGYDEGKSIQEVYWDIYEEK